MATDATVDITTASRTLGLSVEALRKRLQRGAAQGYKADDGTWRVFLDETEAGAAPGNAGGISEGSSGGGVGLAAEVTALKEDVRILKSHLGDLRRALEETVSGRAAAPALPSLSSPHRGADPVLEQPVMPSGSPSDDHVLPDTDAAWVDADSGDDGFGAIASHPNGSDPNGVDRHDPQSSRFGFGWGGEGDDPFAPPEGPEPGFEPDASGSGSALSEDEMRRLIAESVDERLKPVLEILREALLAMRRPR